MRWYAWSCKCKQAQNFTVRSCNLREFIIKSTYPTHCMFSRIICLIFAFLLDTTSRPSHPLSTHYSIPASFFIIASTIHSLSSLYCCTLRSIYCPVQRISPSHAVSVFVMLTSNSLLCWARDRAGRWKTKCPVGNDIPRTGDRIEVGIREVHPKRLVQGIWRSEVWRGEI